MGLNFEAFAITVVIMMLIGVFILVCSVIGANSGAEGVVGFILSLVALLGTGFLVYISVLKLFF
jgi:uncharacterized Tic20 family protein